MLKLLVIGSILSTGFCMPGGYSVVDDSERQRYVDMLTETMTMPGILSLDPYTIVQIETQVVAGLNIRYTLSVNGGTCHLTIFDQPWTKTRSVHDNTCPKRSVRQLGGMMVGGYMEQKDAAMIKNYTLMLENLQSSTNLDLSQFTVEKVETQVVAGQNIRYTLSRNGVTCEIVVFDQPWTHTRMVTHNDCLKAAKRQLLGGFNNVDPTDPQVQQCMSMSLDRVNAMSNNMFRVVESNIVSAKQQVLPGNVKYAVTFQTAQSTCMNSGDQMGKMASKCPVDANSVMTPSTWTGHCTRHFEGGQAKLSFSNIEMNEEPTMNLQLDNDLDLTLKPVAAAKINSIKAKDVVGKVEDRVLMGKPVFKANSYNQPELNLVRKKRNFNFLVEKLDDTFGNAKDVDSILEDGKALLGGGNDHDLINHVQDLIGQDGHDMINHGGKILGGDGHDLAVHVEKILGGDDHDLVNHGKKLLGGDDHDLIKHGKKLLGGDDHDLVNHGKNLLGGDDHDLIKHGKNLLGGDDHDLIKHGKNLLGGDDHDLIKHGEKLLGGDDHDLVNHGKNLLGGDDHDLIKHGKNLLGGDDHDLIKHGKSLLGGDDHDLIKHGKSLLGGDDHDLIKHGKNLLGGDDHDLIDHPNKMIGGDGHDLVDHGGDIRDLCSREMFREFKARFNKLYGSAKEEEKRYLTFCDNMRMARKLQETEKGSAVYGATKFADLTKEEFQQYVGKKWDITANKDMKKAAIPRVSAPESFDWREHGAVTPVKNQGSCGSCWAFSTTGNIEGQWAIKKKKLVSLSEQELVDCDKVDEGCNGGLPSNAYKEIERLGGLETESDYSYKGEDEKCHFNKTDVKVYINDSVSVSSDEAEMASWLAVNGPISIGINAFAMQFYMGGISHPWKIFCNPKNLDHGVLIVGYGVQDSEPYWIVKNSWGPDWGEKGYYLVYRGAGVCGLNTMCTSAVVN